VLQSLYQELSFLFGRQKTILDSICVLLVVTAEKAVVIESEATLS